jgi:polyhydroxyalkanoate synthesis regulator phasin
MSEAVVVALISGGISLVGIFVSNMMTAKKNETTMKVNQAVTDTKLEELTREVREHNNFAQRTPVLEQRVGNLESRVSTLEQYHKAPVN